MESLGFPNMQNNEVDQGLKFLLQVWPPSHKVDDHYLLVGKSSILSLTAWMRLK